MLTNKPLMELHVANDVQRFSFSLSHLDKAEADPLFGQVGVVGDVRLSLHH